MVLQLRGRKCPTCTVPYQCLEIGQGSGSKMTLASIIFGFLGRGQGGKSVLRTSL